MKKIEPTGELMSSLHCRYAIASATTSVGKGAAEDLLRGMLFRVRLVKRRAKNLMI